MFMVKSDYEGNEIERKKMETDKDKLNVYTFDACQLVTS